MSHRADEIASLLFAFILAIVDVRLMNLISRFFWPIVDYLFSTFPSSNFQIEGLKAFETMMSQLLVFTMDLIVYFAAFMVVISAVRLLR